jgi:hypothetical protein
MKSGKDSPMLTGSYCSYVLSADLFPRQRRSFVLKTYGNIACFQPIKLSYERVGLLTQFAEGNLRDFFFCYFAFLTGRDSGLNLTFA